MRTAVRAFAATAAALLLPAAAAAQTPPAVTNPTTLSPMPHAPKTGCSIAVSGAVTGTLPCNAVGTTLPDGRVAVTVMAMTDGTSMLAATLTSAGALTPGTLTCATVPSAMIMIGTGPQPSWTATGGTNQKPQGSCSVTIQSASAVARTQVMTLHGTLTATLTPAAGSGATGTVNVAATF